MELSVTQLFSAFLVLFAVIDVIGSVPVFLGIKGKNRKIHPEKAALYALIVMVAFFFVGDWILSLFGVDVSSFAVAGSIVIFVIAVELTFDVEIFKNEATDGNATLVPVVFPLLAGPGVFTTLLSLRAEYNNLTIIIALLMNAIVIYLIIKNMNWVERIFGKAGIAVIRKFFGIILLAISIKLFAGNITALMESF